MRRILLALVTLTLAGCSAGDGAEGPPDVAGTAFEADPQPYDPNLDAMAAIDAALSKARAENKRVLISMGGNWCPDCRVLSGMMEVPGLADMIERRFEVVKVDVGRPLATETGDAFAGYERNAEVAARFGAEGFEGVPTLLVLTPSGELLNADEPSIFRNARDRDPQDLADYLYRYAGSKKS